MQGKGPTIPVRLNRRVLLRPMAMMAGDNLVDIRKATRDNRAEFRNSVKVYNGSVAAVMNRELGIQYRELAFRVSTFRRKQHTMYKTMCQLVALKRKMLKDAIAKEDHDARDMDIVARHVAVNNAARGGVGVGARALPPLESIASALAEISRANRPSPPPPKAPPELASRTSRLLAPLPTLASPSNLTSSGDEARSLGADVAVGEERRRLHWTLEPVADRVQPKATTRSALVTATTSVTERALKFLADSSTGAAGRLSREPAVRSAVSPPPFCSVRAFEPPPADATQVVTSANAKKAFFTATISKFPALPPIGEAPGCGSAEDDWGHSTSPKDASAQPAPMSKTMPPVAKCWRLAARPVPSSATDNGDSTGADKVLWPASQTSRSQDIASRTSPDRPSATVSQSADSGSATGSGRFHDAAIPLAAEVRRARKLKDAKRKEVLDSELCPVYRQTASGYFRAEETPYRREEFHVPTGSAEYRRRKLLLTVKSTIDEHAAKAKAFLASISLQEEKENKVPVIKTPEILPPVIKFKSAPVTDSARDLEKCTYVRRYIRPSERDANLPMVTSWHQKE